MYMYRSYIIVYIQLVDLCSTNTRNKKVSIQKLRMKNILIKHGSIIVCWRERKINEQGFAEVHQLCKRGRDKKTTTPQQIPAC